MFRKLYILPLTIIALQILAILLFGASPTGSLLTNLLQILASGLAAMACVRAGQRARGMGRPFWWLMGCGMAGWAIANFGWMYYENWLHIETPQFSAVRFVFNFHPVFYAIALFLDKDKDSPEFGWETLLDSVQVGLVFFSVFLGLYYMHQLQGALTKDDDLVLERIFAAVNLALAGFAAIQWVTTRRPRIRSMYSAAALFLCVYFLGSYLAEYAQTVRHLQTGTWFDFGWVLPFLLAAVLADRWVEPAELPASYAAPVKTFGRLSLKNLAVALPPLIVLILVSQFGPGWRRIGFSLVGVSIFCYAARLGISQYRESHSEATVRHHTLAMESAVEGMAILNAAGQFTYMNSAHARLFGYSRGSELLGKSWRVLYQAQEVARFEKDIMPQVFGAGGWSGEAQALRRDGTLFPQELSLTRLNDGGLVCVCRDITERLNADRARTLAEAKYRTLIEQVAAISYIAELGLSGEWHYVSPQIGSILGYTPEEWLGSSRDWVRHVHPEDHTLVEAAEAASSRGERFQAEYRMIRKDGQVIWVSDTAVVVRDSQGHSLMEGIIVDITERKQLETQLQQSRRMEAVGRLAGGIAHDFNNLLTIVKGYTELALNRAGLLPEVRADIEHIEDASERATTLVRQLLAFSRKQILQPKILDLNSIVLYRESGAPWPQEK